jgi:chemotaxis regulatin CheY-phosphate phosphatase CheZ
MEQNEQTISNDPSMSNFVNALHGIIPTLDRIKNSIEESTGKIPQVSRQLNSVASATESATVEILNVLDASTQKLSEMEKSVLELKNRMGSHSALVATMRTELTRLLAPAEAAGLLQNLDVMQSDYIAEEGALAELETRLTQVKEETMVISIALQVQDITSQQIAGVSQLVEAVRSKLSNALYTFEHPVEGEAALPAPGEASGTMPRVFDHGASYDTSADRQTSADEIVKLFQEDKE